MRHEFLPTFKIAAIFLPLFLSSKDKKTKLVVDKEKKEKNPKCEGFFVFGHFFEAQNEASPIVYSEVRGKTGRKILKIYFSLSVSRALSLLYYISLYISKRSARLCTGRSRCGYKGERGGEAKKRYRDTERARDGPKRHANYGPSLPVSIPTLGESLAQVWLAQTPAFPEGLLGVKDGWRKGWRHRADTLKKK